MLSSMSSRRSSLVKPQFAISLISIVVLFAALQPFASASAAPSCKRAAIATVNTSIQEVFPGDALTVTFRGVGGGCTTGNFREIVSSSSTQNSQGYLIGTVSNIALSVNPTGSDSNFQRVTHTREFTVSDVGKSFQYFFVTTSGVKVRSVVVTVSESFL